MAKEIADSKLLDTWGSSGTKIEPDISKIIEGWQLGEQPPHEYMNWLQNTFGSKLNHILKNGIAEWNNETEYLAGATIQHNGSIWICQEINVNSEPTELNNKWGKITSIENLALTIDTIDDFPTSATTGDTCIVKDLDRGGIFVHKTESEVDPNTGELYEANGGNVFARDSGFWVKQEQKVIHSSSSYATKTLHDSVIGLSHAAGTVYELSKSITGYDAWTYGLIEFDINTTTSGMIKLLINGSDIFGDQPNGYLFSTDTILLDGIENNRILDNHTYTFAIGSMSNAITSIGLETDTFWAGTVNSIKLYKLNINSMGISIVANSDIGQNYATGIKGGKRARGDMAFGDTSALMAFQYDGDSPTPAYNLAVGYGALSSNQRGDENTAVGSMSLMNNEGSNNVALGYSSLKLNTKGQENTSVGYKSGASNTTGFRNTYLGFWAGARNKTGSQNTVVGWQTNTTGTNKSYTTSVGSQAGGGLRGDSNVSIGALSNITTIGQETIDVEGAIGIGVGSKSFSDNAIAIGYNARAGSESLSTLVYPIAIGYNSSSQGNRSIAIGQDTLITGTEQTVCLGALIKNEGSFNTIIGSQAGTGFDGNYNTFLGYGAGNQATNYENSTCVGRASNVTGSNQVQLGDNQTTVYVYGTVQNRSDKRDKADIRDTILGLDFIMKLRPVDYRWDMRDFYRDVNLEAGETIEVKKDGSRKRKRFHHGLIAQEVKETMDSLGLDFGGLQDHSIRGGDDILSIGYDEFIAPLIKAVQELSLKVKDLESKLNV